MFKKAAPESSLAFMLKVAEAFEAAGSPFAVLNRELASLGSRALPKTVTATTAISDHIRLSFDSKAATKMTVGAKDGAFRIALSDRAESKWVSLGIDLPVEVVRDARYVGVLLEMESRGITSFKPCLRYHHDTGFNDRFPATQVICPNGLHQDLAFMRVDPAVAKQARRVELLFFFAGDSFDLTLHIIETIKV